MDAKEGIELHFRLSAEHTRALRRLHIETLADILTHFPSRYESVEDVRTVSNVRAGESVVLYGVLSGLKARKAWKRKIPIGEGYLEDGTGKLKVMWFNQPYLAKMVRDGAHVKLAGRIAGKDNKLYLANPEIEAAERDVSPSALFGTGGEQALFPVYPEAQGVTSKWFYHAAKKLIAERVHEQLPDLIPADILARYHLPTRATALVWAHTPKTLKDATSARKRFAFEEVFLIQLGNESRRALLAKEHAFRIEPAKEAVEEFVSRFSFPLTGAQRRAIETILSDMKRGSPMSRLLEGDVGSGKTAVAATTAQAVTMTRPRGQDFGTLQVAYMAPTEILAKQHFESFCALSAGTLTPIGLITGSGCRKFPSKVDPSSSTSISRAQLLTWVANGEIPILIGTHALIEKAVRFKHLAYIIIDEQHRFGTAQRATLAKKEGLMPHLLSMTATPIPRTLALTIYGDLDLSLLDEMPPGRRPVVTEVAWPDEREAVYARMREELRAGRQAYVICPRIDEPDPEKELALNAKSVKAEAKRLKSEVFPEYGVDILHSKMKAKDKDEVMERFLANDIQVLVATSVVEVGVNVPNATVILIEGAERFGLAQLHQLRGRVLRSTHQAYCFLFPETRGAGTRERLKALTTAKNGFELAERDLEIRGPGELTGGRQWGLSDVAMEALRNIKMVEAARAEARRLVNVDPSLSKHPALREAAEAKMRALHLE